MSTSNGPSRSASVGIAVAVLSTAGILSSGTRPAGSEASSPGVSGEVMRESSLPSREGASLGELVSALAATDTHLAASEVIASLADLSAQNPAALSPEKLATIVKEWAYASSRLDVVRELSQEFSLRFPDEAMPEWMAQFKNATIAGSYLARAELNRDALAAVYMLAPADAKQEGIDWIEVTSTLESDGQPPTWLNVSMPPLATSLYTASSVSAMAVGTAFTITSNFIVYDSGYEMLSEVGRTQAFKVVLSADGVHGEPSLVTLDGEPILSETRDLMAAFAAVKAAEFVRAKAKAEAQPVREESPAPSLSTDAGATDNPLAARLVGKSAPPVTLVDWKGAAFPNVIASTSDLVLDGKVTVLDFWAVWCGPCQRAMSSLGELNEELGDEGVQVVSLCRTNEPSDFAGIEDFVRANVRHPFALATPETFANYGPRGLPTYVVIDGSGIVRFVASGLGNEPTKSFLRGLLKEKPQ